MSIETKYRDRLRNMPCFNCGEGRHGLVSWHHLRCLQQAGGAMKAPYWATIPVCDACHKKCHDYTINRKWQKMAMLETWMKVGIEVVGEEQFWRKMGSAFDEIMERV